MITAAYPLPSPVWSRPQRGRTWHARRSHVDDAALCGYTPRSPWVGVREADPVHGPYPVLCCRRCVTRQLDS